MTGGKVAGECEICDIVVKDLWSHLRIVHGLEYKPEQARNKRPETLCNCADPQPKPNGECPVCGRLVLIRSDNG